MKPLYRFRGALYREAEPVPRHIQRQRMTWERLKARKERGSELTADEEQALDLFAEKFGPEGRGRRGAPDRNAQQLADRIQQILSAEQAKWDDYIAQDPELQGIMGSDRPMFADTQVLTGDDVVRILDTTAPVALVYDGAGYDYLSYERPTYHDLAGDEFGDLAAEREGEGVRDRIMQAAERLGYHAEDHSTWAMTFWLD